MHYQRRYIQRLADRIYPVLARGRPFTAADVAALTGLCVPNLSEALGLLLARGKIGLVRRGCHAWGLAVYRRV